MAVELLFWEGCPSHPEALEQLREALAGRAEVVVREIFTEAQAADERFPGSPTIRIDGEDIAPPAEGDPFSLTCRVYRTRDGRFSPLPDPEDLREAIRSRAG